MAITLDGTSGITTPDITSEAGLTVDGVSFASGAPANTLVTTSGGNVGVGTSSPVTVLQVGQTEISSIPTSSFSTHQNIDGDAVNYFFNSTQATSGSTNETTQLYLGWRDAASGIGVAPRIVAGKEGDYTTAGNAKAYLSFSTVSNNSLGERARIDSSGKLLVGTTNTNPAEGNVAGTAIGEDGRQMISAMGSEVMRINRGTSDGVIVYFHQAGTAEGSISVSGTTVSYNGGHLARWAQTTAPKDEALLKGTVLSNLDEMNVYVDADGNPVDNEQLNKVKVSDVEGDANVAGVFVNWDFDEAHNVDEINMAMTGDMIIRIAAGTTVARGDLLMSAGDGTAKPQGDDIVRSKTIAKVTSTHVTCTYDDGSYCVPCVLMAC
jgi:hypothetical protein